MLTENALYFGVNCVFSVFLRNINSSKRFLGSPPKEVLNIGIAYFFDNLFWKSKWLVLPKHNSLTVHIENARFVKQLKKPKKIYTVIS